VLGGVSESGHGEGRVQGRSLTSPRHAAGAGAGNTDPHHSGTDELGKGGPLWLHHEAYSFPVRLQQDHPRVLPTAASVTTRTGFHPQVRPRIPGLGDGPDGGDEDSCGISCEESPA
jgi:hypothetical protein